MSVPYPFTTEALVTSLAGQLAIDLRLDDSADADADMDWAIDEASVGVSFYLQDRYSDADAADNRWIQGNATWFAVRVLCQRRLNDVPEAIEKECKRREDLLTLVAQRKYKVPGLAGSRRPVAISNYVVRLRDFNNQIKTDRTRSTGVAQDYKRPTDDSAPDDR